MPRSLCPLEGKTFTGELSEEASFLNWPVKGLWYPMEVQSKAGTRTHHLKAKALWTSRSDKSLRAVLKGDPEGVATMLSLSDNRSGIYTCFNCSAERERARERERESKRERDGGRGREGRERERETTPFRTHRQKGLDTLPCM